MGELTALPQTALAVFRGATSKGRRGKRKRERRRVEGTEIVLCPRKKKRKVDAYDLRPRSAMSSLVD